MNLRTTPPVRRTVALVVAALVLLPACAKSDDRASGDDDQVLRVYSGRHYDVEKAFEQYETETGVRVEFLTGNDVELRERIAAEGDDTEADVYITVDAGNLATAAKDGLFRSIDSPTLERVIPEQYRDPEGRWFALALRARTIVYNSDLLSADEVPTTYEELAEPQWKGRVCMRNAANGYQQSLVASLIAQHGADRTLEILKGWAANADIYANDVELIEALGAEACEVGVANHYYLARLLEEDPDLPVDLVWANQGAGGTHVNVSGGGVTRAARHPEMGQQFLEWLATDGQRVLVEGNHELPANVEVEPEQMLVDEFGVDFERQDIPADRIGLLNPEAVDLMDRADFG